MTTPHALAPLSFERLNEMLDDYRAKEFNPPPGRVERWAFWIGLFGAGAGMVLGVWLANETGLLFARIGLAVEVAGLGLSLVLTVIREWRSFRHARKHYAEELDHDYTLYRRFVAELRKYPLEERETRLRYIHDRRQVMGDRMRLFSGGVEKLGVIPLLIALYLQFKDWQWGDWDALADVNLVQGLLIWTLVLAYAVAWHLITLRSRVESIELLLAEANRD